MKAIAKQLIFRYSTVFLHDKLFINTVLHLNLMTLIWVFDSTVAE